MVKFIQCAFKKEMIKVNENGKDVWYDADAKAKGYAKSAFKEGDEVELVIEQREGKSFVMQVRKPGQSAPQATQAPTTGSSAPVQAPVSQSVPQMAPAPVKQAWNGGGKSPEESEKITRLSVMSTAANAAQILTGQIQDPVVLGDVVVQLYHKFLAEIKN